MSYAMALAATWYFACGVAWRDHVFQIYIRKYLVKNRDDDDAAFRRRLYRNGIVK